MLSWWEKIEWKVWVDQQLTKSNHDFVSVVGCGLHFFKVMGLLARDQSDYVYWSYWSSVINRKERSKAKVDTVDLISSRSWFLGKR